MRLRRRIGRAPTSLAVLLLVTATAVDVKPVRGQQSLDLTLENIYGPRHRARSAQLSPDGRFAAVTATGTEGSGIYLVPTDGSQPVGTFWVEGNSPSWFPDGERIVFRRGGDLWIVRRGQVQPTRLTVDDMDERAPRVSPNGQWVAFYSGRSGYQDIWIVATDGSAPPEQVTFDANGVTSAEGWVSTPTSCTWAYASSVERSGANR